MSDNQQMTDYVCNCNFEDGECQAPQGCRSVEELRKAWPLVSELRAEVERLNLLGYANAWHTTENERLRAEKEKLQALLRRVLNDNAVRGMMLSGMYKEVRAALDEGLPTAEDVKGILKSDAALEGK